MRTLLCLRPDGSFTKPSLGGTMRAHNYALTQRVLLPPRHGYALSQRHHKISKQRKLDLVH